jgi:hypothetical protein
MAVAIKLWSGLLSVAFIVISPELASCLGCGPFQQHLVDRFGSLDRICSVRHGQKSLNLPPRPQRPYQLQTELTAGVGCDLPSPVHRAETTF